MARFIEIDVAAVVVIAILYKRELCTFRPECIILHDDGGADVDADSGTTVNGSIKSRDEQFAGPASE